MAAFDHPLPVPTCIGCGSRFRAGSCPDGCDDAPLDLVETAAVESLLRYVDALDARVAALAEALAPVTAETGDWPAVQDQARRAIRSPRPTPPAPAAVIAAWGCTRCGRVDEPQPCIGVCIRRPVMLSLAADLRTVAAHALAVQQRERDLAAAVGLVAHTTPQPGQLDATRAALAERARRALADDSP